MDVKEINAEPSVAPEAQQYDGWDEKGTPIVTKKSEAPPESSEAKAESAAESEAAKSSQEKVSHKPKPKPTADERIAELEATIDKIRKNAGRETKAEASPALKSETKDEVGKAPQELKAPVKPKLEDFKTFAEFDAAKDDYHEQMADYKAAKAVAELKQQQQMERFARQIDEQVTAAKDVYPDVDVKRIDEVADAIVKDQEVPLIVKQRIGRSSVLTHLLYVMTGDQAEFDSFLKLAKNDPLAALDKLVLTENLVKEALKNGKGKSEEGKKTEEGKEAKEDAPEVKPRAPKPVSEVGGRGTAPEDTLVAAARANNFSQFEAEQTRRVMASRK